MVEFVPSSQVFLQLPFDIFIEIFYREYLIFLFKVSEYKFQPT